MKALALLLIPLFILTAQDKIKPTEHLDREKLDSLRTLANDRLNYWTQSQNEASKQILLWQGKLIAYDEILKDSTIWKEKKK